jgi:4-amino-4-deoxy-L-arabinose transferase-like glycosyltransferase
VLDGKVRPFALAAAFFLLVTAAHWIALPILVTWDGHEYLDLSDVLGSERFPHDWLWLRAPLFPFGLKLSFAIFGRNHLSATAVPLAMAVLGCFLVASCVRQVAGTWNASLSLVALAVYPTLITYEHALLTETGTLLFVALALRLALWKPETSSASWAKAVCLGFVLSAGYYWRQSILWLTPWFSLLHVLSQHASRKRRALTAFLQVLLVLLLPWLLKTPWTHFVAEGNQNAYVVQAFAIKQELVPADDPTMARVAAEYREAIEKTEKLGSWSGLPWNQVSRLQAKVNGPSSSAVGFLVPLIARYPARYAAGVGRTLLFFAGFDGAENENNIYRTLVLSPALPDAKIEEGPAGISDRVRQDLFHKTTPGSLQQALWALCGTFDYALIVFNIATIALLAVAVRRRDYVLLAVSGTPVYFALVHAALLLSINRFMVPVYPFTLSLGIALAADLVRRLPRQLRRETQAVTRPPGFTPDEAAAPRRHSRSWVASLIVIAALAVFGLLYAVASFRSADVHQANPAGETGAPGAAAPLSAAFDKANVLPGVHCGSLDGMKLTEDGDVFLWGWAYDPRTGTPARTVILLDHGQPLLPPIPVALERPDVAMAQGTPLLLKSGWNLRLPGSWRKSRDHVLSAYAVLGDNKLGPLGGTLTVAASGD